MQRQLVGALMSSVAVTLLLLALMPVMALGQSENCPAGFDHKSDPPENITQAWGSATLVNSGTAVEFYVKDGYTVEVCVKGGNEGFDTDTIVGEDTKVVSTPTNQAVSHYEWTTSQTPPTTTVPEETTTTVGETTTTAPTTTTTVLGTTSTVDQTTTTTVEATTSSEATTTTTVEATTSSEATTASTLPFTGSEPGDWAAVGASALLVGVLTLLVARTRHFDT